MGFTFETIWYFNIPSHIRLFNRQRRKIMDATITKKQIVIVNTVDKNSYGDIEFTYTGEDGVLRKGKIGNKRVKHFEGILIPQRYVELSFSEAYNKEYVYSAVLVKDLLEEKG